MVSLKGKSKGFTIVELLIVIVVIGILATLVIVTFTGIQQKARNSQRQTDINAIQSHVEAFYADQGFYPTLADLTGADSTKLFKGLDPEALKDPKGGAITDTATATSYGYKATSTSSGACDNTAATVTVASDGTITPTANNGCDKFVATAKLEGSNDYVKQSN